MTFSIEEKLAKVARIKELEKAGLNTPRMYFLQQSSSDEEFEKALNWAKDIHEKDENQIFNIRTYRRANISETLNTEHSTDIPWEDLSDFILGLNMHYHCMIDAETPDNGRLSGNIVIFTDPFSGRPNRCLIEYCKKEKRAMVRDSLDHIIEFDIGALDSNHADFSILNEVYTKAKSFPKKDVVLEWTWFCNKAGIKGENLLFWEYRRYE